MKHVNLILAVAGLGLLLASVSTRVFYGWGEGNAKVWEIGQVLFFAAYSGIFFARFFRQRKTKVPK